MGKQHTNIILCRGHTGHALDSYPVCVCVTQTTIERRRFFLFPGTDLFAGKKVDLRRANLFSRKNMYCFVCQTF